MPRDRIPTRDCTNCGRTTTEFVTNQQTGGAVCSSCRDVILFESSFDNQWYPRLMRVSNPDGGWMTRQQRDESANYTPCGHCQNQTHNDQLRRASNSYEDVQLCGWCYDHETTECGVSSCGNVQYGELTEIYRPTRSADRTSRISVCNHCLEEAQECNSCGVAVESVPGNYSEEHQAYYCSQHIPRLVEPEVMNYFYNPTTQFHTVRGENTEGKYWKKDYPYYGIELEVDTPNDDFRELAAKCHLLGDTNKVYLKEDSSTDGFEIITHPMTFEAQKKFGWRKILEQLHKEGARGYDSGNCGIHVHITKSSYSPLTWWKVVEFTYKCKSFIKMFAQRNGNYTYCNYLRPSSYSGYNDRKNTFPSNPSTRYTALNFGDRHPTAEFRLFRATTKHERFWASIEFTHALMDYCSNHGYPSIMRYDSEQVWGDFIKHVAKKTPQSTLLKHLKRRNLTNHALCV